MSTQREAFIKKYAPDVIAACRKALQQGYKIFPSVVMAQMLIESANSKGEPGKGITALNANNFFGIKADSSWTGKTMSFNTPNDGKPVSLFRVYDTVQDSVIDHNNFFIANSRYKKDDSAKGYANIFDDKTPEEQAQDIAAARYSENYQTYGNTLISLINAYNLKELDAQLFEVDLKKKS